MRLKHGYTNIQKCIKLSFMLLTGTLYICEGEFVEKFFFLEHGSRRDQDILKGGVLLQMKTLLFPEDQETEEGGGSLGACDASTEGFQAEGGLTVVLDRDFREITAETLKATLGDVRFSIVVSNRFKCSRLCSFTASHL